MSCKAKFSTYITQRLKNDIKFHNIKNTEVSETMCMNFCKKAPNIKLNWNIEHYMTPVKASELLMQRTNYKKPTQKK